MGAFTARIIPEGARAGAAALAIAALALAGCAATPEPPPRLTASDAVGPNFSVPPLRDRMVYLARQEWALFGRPTVVRGPGGETTLAFPPDASTTHEVQPPMLSRVLLYWYAVTRQPIVGYQGELRPWSAAFVSWLARSAGLGSGDFPATVLHWDYIERFLGARDGDRFATRDPLVYAPQVGDLVCASRGAARSFVELRRGGYHCDLVVTVLPGEIEAIGGNVGDVVAAARFATDNYGRLVPLPDRPWVAVIELRDGARP